MRYEAYKKRVLKRIRFLMAVKRRMGLIIAAFLGVVALFSLGVGLKGTVYYTSLTSEVEYGTSITIEAKAFFNSVVYEFAEIDSEQFSAVEPRLIGEYKVRAVSVSAFGEVRYSKPHPYSIVRRKVEVSVSNTSLTYGDTPEVDIDLAYDDELADYKLDYSHALDFNNSTLALIPETIKVINKDGENVEFCYEFSSIYKKLGLHQKPITLTTGSLNSVYDGKPLKYDSFEVTEGELVEGDTVMAVFNDELTDVGSIRNSAEYRIVNSLGHLVTPLYDITIVSGWLTNRSRPLLINLQDGEKIYDGTPLKNDSYSIDESTPLVDGHRLELSFATEITNAGEAENILGFKILKDQTDLTHNYAITITQNKLTVKKRQLTIKTDSFSKAYDGTPLVGAGYSISEGELVAGQTLDVEFLGSQTYFGTSENTASATIFDNNLDATLNYELKFEFGALEITKSPLTIRTATAQFSYNGTIQTDTTLEIVSGSIMQGEQVNARILNDLALSVGVHKNVLAVEIMRGQFDVSDCYEIEYIYGDITIVPFEIELTTATSALTYSGAELFDLSYTLNPTLFLNHRAEVYGDYSTVKNVGDSATNQFLVKIMDGDTDISQNYDISYVYGTLTVAPLDILITTATNSFYYDGQYHSDGDFSPKSYTEPPHEMRITSALPSFRDVKRNPDNSVGHYDNIFEVGIFLSGVDISLNYNITYSFGQITIIPRPLTIKTHSMEWLYDDLNHSYSQYDLVGELVAGHQIVPNPVSIRTVKNVMRDQNTVIDTDNSLSIFIKNDEDRFVDFNYDITYTYGKLKILPRALTVLTASREWEYDATSHYDDSLTLLSGELVAGHTLKSVYIAQFCEVERQNGVAIALPNDTRAGVFKNYDLAPEDMSNNYDISYTYGTVKILPRAIEVTTASASFVYDGLMHSDTTCTVTAGTLAKDYHTLRLNGIFPTKTNVIRLSDGSVGGIENRFDIYISDDFSNYADISHNYDITMVYGELKILPRPITIRPVYTAKAYNTTPLTSNLSSVTLGELVEGHVLSTICSGSQTEIGNSPNIIVDASIYLDEQDLTYNYDITYQPNTLYVFPRSLYIIPYSDYKTYDGLPLTDSRFRTGGDKPLPGHTVYATIHGEQTEIGKSHNRVSPESVAILDELGNDVSQFYRIYLSVGVLEVGLSVITVSTQSASKPYDGTPLTAPNYTIEGVLLEGDTITVNVYGSITNPGWVQNSATVTIYNSLGADITEDYVIVFNYGGLEITKPNQNGGQLNDSGEIDTDGFKPDEGNAVTFKATATVSGLTYFRFKSFGDYLYSGWGAGSPYLGGGKNALTLSTNAVSNLGTHGSVYIEPLSFPADYLLPHYANGGYKNILDDTVLNFDVTAPYTIDYYHYSFNEGDNLRVDATMTDFERQYYRFVRSTYLQLPQDTKTAMLKVIKDNNLDPNSPTIISEVIDLVQNYVKYSFDFSYEGDIAVHFFTKAKTGICQHYATAATALLRALGIPARYTIGYAANLAANQTIDVTPNQAHAWVEVYIKGAGFVPIEVTGAGEGNAAYGGGFDGSEMPVSLTIKPKDVAKEYDGTPLFALDEVQGVNLDSVVILEKLLNGGYTLEISVDGQRTERGVSESNITTFIVYDQYQKNVTSQFSIQYERGRVRVTGQAIEIVVFELRKNYDGTPLNYNSDDYYLNKPLKYGYTLHFELVGGLTDAGLLNLSELESLPFTLYNERGEDVSENYELIFMGAPLRIDRRVVEFTSASQTKAYDGTPLINKGIWLSKGQLPEDYSFEAAVTGSIIDIGSVYNTFESVKIYDSFGYDATKNFDIRGVFGTLKIV